MFGKFKRYSADCIKSILLDDVIVNGDVNARGHVELAGVINGDVVCDTLHLRGHGRVAGTISARKID